MACIASACGMVGHMGRVVSRPTVTPAPTVTPGGSTTVSYREDVATPILKKNCDSCHGGQIGLYVDS